MDELKKYFGRALDPIHVGAGGYRLGAVDNTIVREPATDVPKIPGTSLAGVIREFATIHTMENDEECKKKNSEKEKRDSAEEEIKQYFGDGNRQGMLRFYDGQIIFFPVSSIQGTVWITTKELLEYWLGEVKDKDRVKIKIPDEINDKAYAIKGVNTNRPLNLGWVLLEVERVQNGKNVVLSSQLEQWVKRILIVSDKLFSQIANDNLEVRTSVRINPTTGTAAEGALFTYEAIPRGTIIGFEVGIDTRREDDKDDIASLIKATFSYLKLFGIGGLGTRGFGRIDVMELGGEGNDNQQS
ncbi:MAG: type III-B CRISPR module RAMP protein Cmr4 [Candidatus Methanofastidiosa archaeon]|nr:type III-B CRISPR module RAMP protein Cmr4 [Candidatus Methanofastidiosa archaeon]